MRTCKLARSLAKISKGGCLLACELACSLAKVAVLSPALQNAGKVRAANAADRTGQLRLTSKIAT